MQIVAVFYDQDCSTQTVAQNAKELLISAALVVPLFPFEIEVLLQGAKHEYFEFQLRSIQ